MTTYALTQAGVVVNIIVVEEGAEWSPPSGHELFAITDATPDIGDFRNPDGTYSRPPVPVPTSISPLQARKALRQAGLKAAVDAYVASLSEEEQEEWEYAIEVQRTGPTINNGWALLGRSQAELDDLFRLGATL